MVHAIMLYTSACYAGLENFQLVNQPYRCVYDCHRILANLTVTNDIQDEANYGASVSFKMNSLVCTVQQSTCVHCAAVHL